MREKLSNYKLSKTEKVLIEELYDTLYLYMTKISINLLNDKNLSEEAISNTFIKIINNIDRIKNLKNDQQIPYCITILKNECYNILRKNKETYFNYNDASVSYEDDLIDNLDFKKLENIISELNTEDKKLIFLRYYDNLKWKEISDRLNITEEAARKRNQRILNSLKDRIIKGEK